MNSEVATKRKDVAKNRQKRLALQEKLKQEEQKRLDLEVNKVSL